jgi:hypothetical protein
MALSSIVFPGCRSKPAAVTLTLGVIDRFRPRVLRKLKHQAALMLVLLLGAAAPAVAATLVVAARGQDGPGCGTKTQPCRSVSRAIAHARAGDTIEVGPGRYGDIAQDGDFTDPGDEAAEIDTGCDCMIHVDKRLTLVARDGAEATILDARAAPIHVVAVDVPGTVVGKKGKGFTLTGGGTGGSGLAASTNEIIVAGNLAAFNGKHGIDAAGPRVRVTDNRMIGNASSGCQCGGNASFFARNVATDNGAGFFTGDGSALVGNLAMRNTESGFEIVERNVIKGNVAIANGEAGFTFYGGDNVATGNVAHANYVGFRLFGGGNLLLKCAIVGNLGVGVLVEASANAVHQSSLYGNAAITGLPPQGANCGTIARGSAILDATGNFWGAATGPGPDPADAVCDQSSSSTTVVPVASREIRVKPVVPR